MKCRGYDRHQAGRWSDERFERHAAACPDCRRALAERRAWSELAAPVRSRPIDAPALWDRIEAGLRAEMAASTAGRPNRAAAPGALWLRRVPAAAGALIGLVAASVLLVKLTPTAGASGLLDEKALARVERQERDYVAAIEALEAGAAARLSGWDQQARLLYRDKLETLDRQIERCRAALEVNPANARIRRFLLAALQEKKETLAVIRSWEPEERPGAASSPAKGPRES